MKLGNNKGETKHRGTIQLYNHIVENAKAGEPVISSAEAMEKYGVSKTTYYNIICRLQDEGVISTEKLPSRFQYK